MRQHQRSLQKAQRELDRERSKLEVQEKKLIADIKKSAKAGHMVGPISYFRTYNLRTQQRQQDSCKIMAKDLVRTRRYVSKFYSMRTQLQAVSLRLQSMRSNQQMAEAMRGATKVRTPIYRLDFGIFVTSVGIKAMSGMSRNMNIPAVQKILLEFQRESDMMDMKEEFMSDAVDGVMEVLPRLSAKTFPL